MQAFAAENSEATTDEEGRAAKGLQEQQESSSEADRRAVLERLQGEDNPLAAGFKVSPDLSLHMSHSGVQSACS